MVDIGGNVRGVWMAGWDVDGGWRGARGGGEGSGRAVVVVVVVAVAGCTETRSRKQTHIDPFARQVFSGSHRHSTGSHAVGSTIECWSVAALRSSACIRSA